MLKIVTVPHTILTTPAQAVETVDGRIKKLVREMEKTLVAQTDPEGVGLAAPQIGESLRLFIMKPSKEISTKIFINPKILKTGALNKAFTSISRKRPTRHSTHKMEGCLSIPRIWAPLRRSQRVTVEYQSLDGLLKREVFADFGAIIIQHEADHLDGILFTQRCLEQGVVLYEEEGDELRPMKT